MDVDSEIQRRLSIIREDPLNELDGWGSGIEVDFVKVTPDMQRLRDEASLHKRNTGQKVPIWLLDQIEGLDNVDQS